MIYSPMMQQYLQTKDEYKDSILLYRLGDFYEMFFRRRNQSKLKFLIWFLQARSADKKMQGSHVRYTLSRRGQLHCQTYRGGRKGCEFANSFPSPIRASLSSVESSAW